MTRMLAVLISLVVLTSGVTLAQEVVTGAPYSAEAVTETSQPLADGKTLSIKTAARIYRDSQGRERREAALNPATGLSASAGQSPTISISDPVAGVDYILDVLHHSAVRMRKISTPPPAFGNSGAGNPAGGFAPAITFQPTPGPGGAQASQWIIVQGNHTESSGPGGAGIGRAPALPVSPTRIELLEPRMIEGLRAEGRRTIETVPANRVGNGEPFEITSETWVSPELKVEVMTRRSDPRTGEVVFHLNNVSRTEPPSSLFEVPSDYAISDAPAISGGIITGGVTVGPPAR